MYRLIILSLLLLLTACKEQAPTIPLKL
ncbi:MAG: hypothetical protein ACJATN_001302, partial [Neolewinella sp.]